MMPVYLICGVSGSGKTWVCKQLEDKFHYVPHDLHYKNIEATLSAIAKVATKPLLTECPFGERTLREELERRGMKIIPVFVIERPETIRLRYLEREKKELPKAAYTRATSIVERAQEWRAKAGTSKEIYEFLRDLPL